MAGPKRDIDKVFEFKDAVNPDFLAVIGCVSSLWITYIAPLSGDRVEVIVSSKVEKDIEDLAQRFGGK